MACIDHKDLLLAVLDGEFVDKPPVIIPAGLVSRPMDRVLDEAGLRSDSIHSDSDKLSELATKVQEASAIENLSVPFILTVESEAYGGEVEESVASTKPSVFNYPYKNLKDILDLKPLDIESSGRLPVVIETLRKLKPKSGELSLPLIGDLVGPLSLASTLIDVSKILKFMAKRDSQVDDVLDFLCAGSEKFGSAMIDSGVDVIFITDPMSTMSVMGPKYFEKYTVPYLNRLTEFIHSRDVPVILHLCEDISALPIELLTADCLSIDNYNSLEFISSIADEYTIMAGISEGDLKTSSIETIVKKVKDLTVAGVKILGTTCALTGELEPGLIKTVVEASYFLTEDDEDNGG